MRKEGVSSPVASRTGGRCEASAISRATQEPALTADGCWSSPVKIKGKEQASSSQKIKILCRNLHVVISRYSSHTISRKRTLSQCWVQTPRRGPSHSRRSQRAAFMEIDREQQRRWASHLERTTNWPIRGAFVSDASDMGWGGGSSSAAAAAGFFTTESSRLGINAKKMRAIACDLRSLGRLIPSGRITRKTGSKVVNEYHKQQRAQAANTYERT